MKRFSEIAIASAFAVILVAMPATCDLVPVFWTACALMAVFIVLWCIAWRRETEQRHRMKPGMADFAKVPWKYTLGVPRQYDAQLLVGREFLEPVYTAKIRACQCYLVPLGVARPDGYMGAEGGYLDPNDIGREDIPRHAVLVYTPGEDPPFDIHTEPRHQIEDLYTRIPGKP